MKIKYLILLISILFFINNTYAVEIYNKNGNKFKLYGEINNTLLINKSINKDVESSYILYGFNIEAKIYKNISIFSIAEQEKTLIDYKEKRLKIDLDTKLSFLGIKLGNLGNISYGNNYGILHDINSWINITPKLKNTENIKFMCGKTHGVLIYRNNNFFNIINNLNFALQLQTKEVTYNNENFIYSHGKGYGIVTSYFMKNGIHAAVAYTLSKRFKNQRLFLIKPSQNGDRKGAKSYYLSLKYNKNNLYLATLYNLKCSLLQFSYFPANNLIHRNKKINFETCSKLICNHLIQENKIYVFLDRIHTIELVAQYHINNLNIKPSICYVQSVIYNFEKENNCTVFKYKQDIKKYIEFGITYKPNNYMLISANYKFNFHTDTQNMSIKNVYYSNPHNLISINILYNF